MESHTSAIVATEATASALAADAPAWYPPAVPLVQVTRLPRHIAIIMDGNGRWALRRDEPRTLGHREGSDAVRRIVRACRRLGVDALTLYAFSAQNWQRPSIEVDALMELLRDYLISERAELVDNGIRLRAVGELDRLPPQVREVLDPLMADTSRLGGMTLTLALSYGGREEIVDAVRALAARVRAGELEPGGIDGDALESALPSLDVGPVDLLIRTGGELRVSNFLLWSIAYAELYFCDRLWPDFDEKDLYEAINAYQMRDRRFGRLSSDVEVPGAQRDGG